MNAPARHVVVVGLPGAGKTTVVRASAAELGWPAVELDAEVERVAGQTVASIFASAGESEFRRLEAQATRDLLSRRTSVLVDAGGGWIANGEARELVPPAWAILYLRVDPAEAASRLGAAASARPLLADAGSPRGVRERLGELAAARIPLYERADAVVETGGRTVEQVVAATVATVRRLAGLER